MSTEGFSFSADGKTLLECDFSQLGTDIIVPDGCTEIADKVFAESPVVSVTLPNSVTKIGENLFSSCQTLKEVKLSDNLTELKPFTFAGCSSLKKVTMSDRITSFPEGLFFGCSSLQSIPFTSSIGSLEIDVCRDCENITSVKIPEGVTEIKTGAFAGCSKLSTIVFPSTLEKIADRSLAGASSLSAMSFSGDSDNFFVDENSGCLYEMTENGCVLIKCPVNQETVYLIENASDCHIDAFEGCTSLAEVYASTEAPETLVNRLMELIPQIDINSYDEPETSSDEVPPEKSDDFNVDISEILNSQCIHNDEHAEGFRPVSVDELEALMMKGPVDVAPQTKTTSDETVSSSSSEKETSSDEAVTDKPKRGRGRPRKEKTEGEAAADKPKRGRGRPRKNLEPVHTESDDANEPRFLRAMKNVAHHQMILEEKENEKESVYGEMKELIVFADGVAPSTDDFSSHLVKFSKDVAKKYGFTKIYFFEDLPLDNPEFMYGLKSFGNAKNILYACNKPCPEKITEDQKELIDATGIELPSDKLQNVKGTLAESGLELPVKILVQDNYIEGLLYCAEKFRAEHGIK
ncbi:MAG: leucine-rich repeat protein [Treponema sp.]|nr:leucine-rich repeat protein [Candidatus Treponema scatequi]